MRFTAIAAVETGRSILFNESMLPTNEFAAVLIHVCVLMRTFAVVGRFGGHEWIAGLSGTPKPSQVPSGITVRVTARARCRQTCEVVSWRRRAELSFGYHADA
jgi:hypothetical protein